MKIDLVFLIVLGIVVAYIFLLHKVEAMADVANIDQMKEAVKQVYMADVESIRNLSNVATKLQAGGITVPGQLTVTGQVNSQSGDNHIPIIAQSNVDSHIQLKTKNDDGKNIYLINRDGHFRVHAHGVGDMFGVNKDGHTYNLHTGDHVHHFMGRGDNPYITISKEGEWGRKSWYLQNVKNDGDNKIFRIGVHDEGPKLDIHKTGNAYFTGDINAPKNVNVSGRVIIGGRDILAEFDHYVNNIAVRRDKKYAIQSDRGGYLSDRGGWQPRPQQPGWWEVMRFDQLW